MNVILKKNDANLTVLSVDEEGRDVSHGGCTVRTMNLNGVQMTAMTVGGVGTVPEHRRSGLVRQFFQQADAFAREKACLVTLLHPFSFAYYNQFGFERVADHRVLEFPMSALGFAPFFKHMISCADNSRNEDLAAVYNEFSKGRNIMFRRNAQFYFLKDGAVHGNKRYIWYDETGKPAAYLILKVENHFEVNRMVSDNLHVYEMCFISPDSLWKLLGFLRMFEGELESVKIHNCAMSPEVEQMLRNYTHTRITVIPDIMARVEDVGGVLNAVTYPELPGRFAVKVEDAVYEVRYADGQGLVATLPADAPYDLACTIGAFTRLVFGYESYGAQTAAYLPGVALKSDCADFFRAFPNRPCGLYEHF